MISTCFEKDNNKCCITIRWRNSDVCYITIEEAEKFSNELDDVIDYAKRHQPPMFKVSDYIIYCGGGDYICHSHEIKSINSNKECYITEDNRRIPFADQYDYEKTTIPPEPKKVTLPDDDQIKEIVRALKNYSDTNAFWKHDIDKTTERVKDYFGKPDLFPEASDNNA